MQANRPCYNKGFSVVSLLVTVGLASVVGLGITSVTIDSGKSVNAANDSLMMYSSHLLAVQAIRKIETINDLIVKADPNLEK